MKYQSPDGLPRYAFLVTINAVSLLLGACGGMGGDAESGSGMGLGSGGTTTLTVPGNIYVTTPDAQSSFTQPGRVYQYAVASDGSITQLSVPSVPCGVYPNAVVSDPSGQYVYVVNRGDGTVSQYTRGAGGALTGLSPATVALPANLLNPLSSAVSATSDPVRKFLYIQIAFGGDASFASPDTSLVQYSIGADGTLTLGSGGASVSGSMGSLVIDPNGKYAYIAGTVYDPPEPPSSQIYQFSISDSGALTPLSPATMAASVATGSVPSALSPYSISITPNGQNAYLLSGCPDGSCSGQIAEYLIGPDGGLQASGSSTMFGTSVNPVALVTDASGMKAYLLTSAIDAAATLAVYSYTVGAAGNLTFDRAISTSGARAEAINGTDLYLLGGQIDQIRMWPDGILSAGNSIEGPGGTAMAVLGLPPIQ